MIINNYMNSITAVILAAGEGKRIGLPKWSLTVDGKTFLSIIIEKIISIGIKNIVCVLKDNIIPLNYNVVTVMNNTNSSSMFSSIYHGLKIALTTKSLGYLIYPVDHPFVKINIIDRLCREFLQHSTKVICPCYKNEIGHPIIIPLCLAQKINFQDYDGGLKHFIRDQNAIIYTVNTFDYGILQNINTKEDIIKLGKNYEFRFGHKEWNYS